MLKRFKKVMAIITAAIMVISLGACGSSNDDPTSNPTTAAQSTEKTTENPTEAPVEEEVSEEDSEEDIDKGEPFVVVFGTHWQTGDDPTWRDEITGESGMSPEDLRAYEKAMEAVLDQLNVKIEWVQYSSDVREELLRSVLANDPICDLALLWGGSQGTLLGQNIMQDLEPYADVFTGDPDTEWMYMDPIFGKRYMLTYVLSQINTWPLVFNATYIERVDALKENGETVYPTDLYKRGEWTWSKFQDYLTKIDAYYKNTPTPTRPEVMIKAFQTDYRFTAVQAMHSNGTALYGKDGLSMGSPEAIKAVEFIDELMSKNLMMSVRYSDDSVVPGWTWNGSDFGNGETVFTNMVSWQQGSAGASLAERGESMGIVPFPRPDDLAVDDPRYQQESKIGNTFCALKGVDAETTRKALEAFKVYYTTYYKEKGNSDTALGYLEASAETNAVANGYDIFHEKIGADILEIFSTYSPARPNETSDILGINNYGTEDIIGQSIYGFDGSPKYAVNVAQKINTISEMLSGTETALASDELVDNINPTVSASGTIVISVGTDPESIDFTQYFTFDDNVDGELGAASAEFDFSATDFNAIGSYEGGVSAKIKDSSGNEGSANATVYIYNQDNTNAPTITVKEEYPTVAVDTNVVDIDWAGAYIESAVDSDGLDIKSSVAADTGELDVTTPGVYDVELIVTDFAGNTASIVIPVTVE